MSLLSTAMRYEYESIFSPHLLLFSLSLFSSSLLHRYHLYPTACLCPQWVLHSLLHPLSVHRDPSPHLSRSTVSSTCTCTPTMAPPELPPRPPPKLPPRPDEKVVDQPPDQLSLRTVIPDEGTDVQGASEPISLTSCLMVLTIDRGRPHRCRPRFRCV